MGNLNAKIGNVPIPNIMSSFEDVCNANENMLSNFATFNLNTTFFLSQEINIHKYTEWAGVQIISLIDYIIVGSKVAAQIRDNRAYKEQDIVPHHFILVSTKEKKKKKHQHNTRKSRKFSKYT